jgi:hypothetical protein
MTDALLAKAEAALKEQMYGNAVELFTEVSFYAQAAWMRSFQQILNQS